MSRNVHLNSGNDRATKISIIGTTFSFGSTLHLCRRPELLVINLTRKDYTIVRKFIAVNGRTNVQIDLYVYEILYIYIYVLYK